MKIEFINEGGTLFAVALEQRYKNKVHEELLYAEITPLSSGFTVRWNDNFFISEPFSSLEEAQDYIKENYHSHEPESNGKAWL